MGTLRGKGDHQGAGWVLARAELLSGGFQKLLVVGV